MVEATRSFIKPDALPVFATFGRSFRILAGAPLLFVLLSILMAAPDCLRLANKSADTINGSIVFAIGALVVYLLLFFWAQVVMSYVAVQVASGRHPSLASYFKLGVRRYLPTLGAFICSSVVIVSGAILLIIPGLIAACALAVVIPVCAVENRGPVDSLRRSADLSEGQRWRIFAILLLSFLPLIIGGLVEGALTDADAFPLLLDGLVALWTPFSFVVGAAIYVGLRRLKENDGLAAVFD